MAQDIISEIYSTSTPVYDQNNFDKEEIDNACGICLASYAEPADKLLSNSCYICGTFQEKNIITQKPFLDFLSIAIIFIIAFLVFDLAFRKIWQD